MQWCIISHGSRGSGDGAGAPATACATLLLSPDRALLPALLSKCSVVLAASAHDITADEHTQECSEHELGHEDGQAAKVMGVKGTREKHNAPYKVLEVSLTLSSAPY